ncbi:ankyrin repeat domain-containing protein [Nordella sp. HKS 07]|nr:ankyrin repeat domain-containing protein [Nordella sp. HKS 07]
MHKKRAEAKRKLGMTPLHAAVRGPRLLEHLLGNGADVNARSFEIVGVEGQPCLAASSKP